MAEQAVRIESQRSSALSNVGSLEQNSQSTYQSQEEQAVQQAENTPACIDALAQQARP